MAVTMPGFESRKGRHDDFSRVIDVFLASAGFMVEHQGVEQFRKALHPFLMQSDSETARFARFQPDGFAASESAVFFFDIKASKDIEKGPYKCYLQFRDLLRCTLFLFVNPCDVEREKYDRLFTPVFASIENKNWFAVPITIPERDLLHFGSKCGKPTDAGGWVTLRYYNNPGSGQYDPARYVAAKGRTDLSGTPFRTFNFDYLVKNKYLVGSMGDFLHILAASSQRPVPGLARAGSE